MVSIKSNSVAEMGSIAASDFSTSIRSATGGAAQSDLRPSFGHGIIRCDQRLTRCGRFHATCKTIQQCAKPRWAPNMTAQGRFAVFRCSTHQPLPSEYQCPQRLHVQAHHPRRFGSGQKPRHRFRRDCCDQDFVADLQVFIGAACIILLAAKHHTVVGVARGFCPLFHMHLHNGYREIRAQHFSPRRGSDVT